MSSRIIRRVIPAAVMAALPVTWVAMSAIPAASAASKTATAVTKIVNRPDSGDSGNWANDSFTRMAKVTLVGTAPAAKCGNTVKICYHWTGVVADKGIFVTIKGATSPGHGYLNGGSDLVMGASITGGMAGGIAYNFYSHAGKANPKLVPAAVNNHGAPPSISTGFWVSQFFPAGTWFWDASGTHATYLATVGGWLYMAAPGADKACPNTGSQWLDASPDWGVNKADGNILAPDAAHC